MNVLEKFIVSRSEKHLQKYRDQAKQLDEQLLHEYQCYLPIIESCYRHAGYWHGTGRYHYQNSGDARYETISTRHTSKVLESILEKGGLIGHQDLWFQDKHIKKTVSVAPLRMHARLFAHMNLREGVWLPYVFGGTRFWMSLLIISIATGSSRKEFSFIRKVLLNQTSLKNFRTWGGSIRNLDELRILPIWRAYDLRSDIPGNHAVLFGIKRSAITEHSLLPAIKEFETRVRDTVHLDAMTHIEVPLENVGEVKQLLSDNNISLPIIPLEFGELYCSQFPLKKLMYV